MSDGPLVALMVVTTRQRSGWRLTCSHACVLSAAAGLDVLPLPWLGFTHLGTSREYLRNAKAAY